MKKYTPKQLVYQRNKKEFRKYVKRNENKNTTYQNLQDAC